MPDKGRRVASIHLGRCAIMRVELAALNAVLLPEANDFLADVPRPLGPLKFHLVTKENQAGKKVEWTE